MYQNVIQEQRTLKSFFVTVISVPIPMLPIFYVPHIVVLYLPKLYFRIQLFSYNIVHII